MQYSEISAQERIIIYLSVFLCDDHARNSSLGRGTIIKRGSEKGKIKVRIYSVLDARYIK